MGRIPVSEIERLKTEVDLVALVRAKGVELKKEGKDFFGRCPFHNDRTPSLAVSPEKNLWHCLGACNVGGSVIDWVMKANGLEFREAVDLLRSGDAKQLLAPRIAAAKSTPEAIVEYDAEDRVLLHKAVDVFHRALTTTTRGMDYLKFRGIADTNAIEKFKIGFAGRSTLRAEVAGHKRIEQLTKIGLIREETGYEHFAGSIVIPVIDGGEITEMYARRAQRCMTANAVKHLYLKGPHRGVWNMEGVGAGCGEVVLCEALIDALTFWVHGIKNVTASYGTNGFTADHLRAFAKNDVKRVLIAYDRDEAGDRGAEKLAPILAAEGIEVWRVIFPQDMDANEYVRKVKQAPAQALKVCLESAELISKPKRLAMPRRKKSIEAQAAALAPTESRLFSLAASSSPLVAPAPCEPTNVVPISAAATAQESVLRPALTPEIPAEKRDEDWFINLGAREYRVRGLHKNLSSEMMRVNLRVAHDMRFHVDQLDLYQAKARTAFMYAAARELGVDVEAINRDLGKVLYKCEELQREAFESRKAGGASSAVPELTEDEKAEALALLRSPDLMGRILADFDACGVVGENTNKLVGYLACVSRKLDEPVAIVIQSSSAAGKSSLMDAVLAMVPPEDCVKFSAMTGQSLFYIGETSLQHRVLAIAEEEGASRASYALKILQSEREINIAATGKDPATGRIVTQEYKALGPVMLMMTTTAIDIDEELMNRCLILSVDEDREQTRAIHEKQRESRTLAGLLSREAKARILKLHQNAQRLLRPVTVVNDYATALTFQDSRTRMRRDHKKYLALIDAIALLHQHSREVHEVVTTSGEVIEYIRVEPSDIAKANELCHEILGRSLDELAPQTRRLLVAINSMVTELCHDGKKRADVRFTRRRVRDYCGWSEIQVRKHMQRLVEMEYVLAHRGTRGSLFVYELVYDGGGADGRPALAGLVDAKMLTSKSNAALQMDDKSEKFEHPGPKFEHPKHEFEHPSSPLRAGFEQGASSSEIHDSGASQDKKAGIGPENALEGSQPQSLLLSKSGGAKRGGARS